MQRCLVFAATYLPLVGGAEVAMKELTDRLQGWEFELYCARLRPDLPREERVGRVLVHRRGFGHPIDRYLLPLTAGLPAALRRDQPDVIWSLMATWGGFAALTHATLRPSARLLLTLQEGNPLEHFERRVGVFRGVHRRIFRRADAVQAISTFLARWATDMGFTGRPVVVPNGVDLATFAVPPDAAERARLRAAHGFAADDVVVITVSRLSLKNGVDDLLRALTHLPPRVKALVAGDGEDRAALNRLVGELGVADRVVFLGTRGHRELPALLQSADVFCRPSLSEGLGNAFLEAMAAGLPIIGTPVGGIPDFLVDGETGVFCQVRDPASLARAVERLLADAALRARVIEQGGRLVREQYGWDGIAGRMAALLDGLAAPAP